MPHPKLNSMPWALYTAARRHTFEYAKWSQYCSYDMPEEMAGAEACPQMLTYREETGNEEYKSCQD